MARWDYEVLAADGSTLTGVVQAASEAEALRELERKGLLALRLTEHRTASARTRFSAESPRESDVILAMHELATMLLSGVPVAEAVAAQAASGHHPGLVAGFSAIRDGIARGQGFSDALAASGIVLPPYVLQLCRAGEMTGRLGESLRDGVAQMEEAAASAAELRNALVYPTILVVAGIAAVLLLFIFVVPKFSRLLDRADDLPLLAWGVLSLGQWVNEHLLLLGSLAIAAVLGLVALLRRPAVRLALLDGASRVPLLGDWLAEAEIGRWASVLAALVGQRVPVLTALDLATDAIRFPQRRRRMAQVARRVRDGVPLSDALEDQDALTATGYNLVRVGERSGELAAMLASLGRLYDEAGRRRMKRFLALIEPLAILLIGSVIGVIILAVILAITSANDLAV